MNSDECNAGNPFEMEWFSDWIRDLQQCACTISVFQAKYNGETVFWQLMNDPLCQSVIENIAVFNCSGEEILILGDYQNWVDFSEFVSDRKIIYACPSLNN